MSELKTIDKEYVANTYARFPVEPVSGKGSLVWDEAGKEYIDMGSGIGVAELMKKKGFYYQLYHAQFE